MASLAILADTDPARVGAAWQVRLTMPRRLAVAGLLALLTIFLVWSRDLRPARLAQTVARVFPVEAARVVAQRGYQGPLYNDFNWGGYLIWSLPQLPVALDGRTNLHGDARIVRIGNTWAGGPGWQDDADLASAGVVLGQATAPLASLLRCDGRFCLVYDDALACVFVRRAVNGCTSAAP
jgi:hypothetical protein